MILKPSKRRLLFLLLIGLAFVAMGIGMLNDGTWEGWLPLGFFGFCSFVIFIQLIFGGSYLELTDAGFTCCTFFRKTTNKWSDVKGFDVGSISRNKMIMFNYSDSYDKQNKSRGFSKMLAGYEGALPDTYSMEAEDLAKLMNEYRDKAIQNKITT